MVATFHLHCLGHRIKYGNLEVGNTTHQLLSATRPCCSIEFIESFLFWVILVTYNIDIYIFVYIFIKLAIFILFLLSWTVMFFLHCIPNILRYEKKIVKLMSRLLHSTFSQVMWYFWVFIVSPFSLLWSIFFLKEIVFPLVSLSLACRWVIQLRYF